VFAYAAKAAPWAKTTAPKYNAAPCAKATAPKCQTTAVANDVASTEKFVDDTISMRASAANTLSHYLGMRYRDELHQISERLRGHSAHDFFNALVQCASRTAQPHLMEVILDDAESCGLGSDLCLYESAMRLLAAKKYFHEALAIQDRVERHGLRPSIVTLSCLVSFAAEVNDRDRALRVFQQISSHEAPPPRACMSMLRLYAADNDAKSSVKLLRELWANRVPTDSLLLNSALNTCVVSARVDFATQLLAELPTNSTADTVSYNTVLKGLGHEGLIDRAIELLKIMSTRGACANIITKSAYGRCGSSA
jgi:pentatricopeptide repeat protein